MKRERNTPTAAAPPPASLADDARGIARLAIDGVVGVANIVEQLHATIGALAPALGPAKGEPTTGITGFVYGRVRDVARGTGWAIDTVLRQFEGALRMDLPEREHVRAALNGVLGDRLVVQGNPLAIPMQLRFDATRTTSRVALFAHGLCMHDLQWPRGAESMHAAVRAMGYTPVYLHYNTGRPIDANGLELSRQLELLLGNWPKRVSSVAIIGHSMGGLVARRAIYHARQNAHAWSRKLKTMVFLGTPHRGSALERAGTKVDFALGMSPYSAPFARLGAGRSAGIQDLGRDSSDVALPAGVRCFAVAGRLKRDTDGLVGISSALGLSLAKDREVVIDGAGHIELMRHPTAVAMVERALAGR